jgi:hypothetical protein
MEFSMKKNKLIIFNLKPFATSRDLSLSFFTLENSRVKVSSRDSLVVCYSSRSF